MSEARGMTDPCTTAATPSPRRSWSWCGRDPRVIVVVNDSVGSTKVSVVGKEFPERVINVGIAEQDLVGVGCRTRERRSHPVRVRRLPVPDQSGPGADQGRCRVLQGANVKLVGVSSGVAYGELGPTHHSIEDVAWMRAIDRPRRWSSRPTRSTPQPPSDWRM